MVLIDTHCHLDVAEFDDDRERVIARARTAGVAEFVVPGIYRDEWPTLTALCRSDPGLHCALGLHPVYLTHHRAAHLEELRDWVCRERPVAIGEIGLDHYVQDLDRTRQLRLFERQLDIAEELRLPVLLHIRKAYDTVLKAVKSRRLPGGICHAFNGSLQQAERFMELGFKFGFGGMLTYERSTRLRRLARELPVETIVLETDAPDLTVASHRFERNSPEYLPEVLDALAQARDADPADLARITTANARAVLGLTAGSNAKA